MLRVLSIGWLLSLVACVSGADRVSGVAPADSEQKWNQAMHLLEEKDWPGGIAALQAIVQAKSFDALPAQRRYEALSMAGKVMVQHGSLELGDEYLVRATALPEAALGDWLARLQAARRLGNAKDSVVCLTVIARKWSASIAQFDSRYLLRIVNESRPLERGTRLSLLQALFDSHWKLKWEIEPSASWRDLALLLLEKARLREAMDVSSHVTDVYVLLAMRADRRFDAIVSAAQSQFDIDAAAEREFHWFQSASEKAPQSLELQSAVLRVLLEQRRYSGMLASADAVLLAIQSTNFPTKLYQDYDEQQGQFLDLRATALERAGRYDEAVTQLTAATLLPENGHRNVGQVIDLGALYCELGRPKDALSAIDSVAAAASPFGASFIELIRLDVSVQTADSKQIESSLGFLRNHRRDSPSDYTNGLILVNQLDRAAEALIAQLRDPDDRQNALLFVQTYAPVPSTAWELELDARRRAVIARSDLQAIIRKVGRVEVYRLEPYD